MAKAKKKLLPKNFEQLLAEGNLADLKSVFETCDVNARGGYNKQTALAFVDCPDELARWLVSEGADLTAVDRWGKTPLHSRCQLRQGSIAVLLELGADPQSDCPPVGSPLHMVATSYHVPNARRLLDHGAQVDARNKRGLTPLELALAGCENADLVSMAELAELLLDAGALRSSQMTDFVEQIGRKFEFHREGFNRDSLEVTNAALERLYELFQANPAPRRIQHDGRSPITTRGETADEQFHFLWEWLVPSSGPAATVQGEVIRIAGRIRRESEGNGGVNWNAEFRKMADAFLAFLQSGHPLPDSELKKAAELIEQLKAKVGDPTPMSNWAVAWVRQNPDPRALEKPKYRL